MDFFIVTIAIDISRLSCTYLNGSALCNSISYNEVNYFESIGHGDSKSTSTNGICCLPVVYEEDCMVFLEMKLKHTLGTCMGAGG